MRGAVKISKTESATVEVQLGADSQLTPEQRLIALIQEKPSSSLNEMASALGVSRSFVIGILSQLRWQGAVERIGLPPHGHWKVRPDFNPAQSVPPGKKRGVNSWLSPEERAAIEQKIKKLIEELPSVTLMGISVKLGMGRSLVIY